MIASTNQSVDFNEYIDEVDVIDLVYLRPPSPPLLPNSTIRVVLAKTPFTEQGLFA
jgi:hypothetical protein